ncbi:helix-turn-helix domain-containing protein [Promicromonospora sp. NPDC052451]|uniref:helix-turn-helix domain-containing protein n=1 Tax=Promicromonospora sp. NPDC052451 TaxID=3364407 RepID=UPI0037C5E7AC
MPHTSPAPPRPTRLVPLADAAEYLHVSVKTLRRRIADGTIAGYRVGRLIRVDLDELPQKLVVTIPSARSV